MQRVLNCYLCNVLLLSQGLLLGVLLPRTRLLRYRGTEYRTEMEKFLVIQSESRGRSKQKYHIAIDDSSVKSNSLYIFPKVSVSRIDPPGYMKMKWFTFSGKKEYYPVIIRRLEQI